MDKATLVKTIAYRMGNVKGQDTAIDFELALSIERLEGQEFVPWFLLSENNFFEGTAQENRIPVPRGFIREYEEGSLYLRRVDGTGKCLIKKSQDQLLNYEGMTGEPSHYSLTNQYFRIYPVPQEDFKVELLFYRKSSTLNVEDNPWYEYAAELLVAETIWAMLSARRDKMADYWKIVAADQMRRLTILDAERRLANQEIFMGGDD